MASLMKKKCGCKRHADFDGDEEGVSGNNLVKISNKKIKSSVLSELRRLGEITHKTNYVCTSCIKNAENCMEKKVDSFDDVMTKISSNQYDENQLVKIASALGESQRDAIKKDALQLSSDYRFLDNIHSFDPQKYFSARNTILVAFMLSVTGLSKLEGCNEKSMLSLIMAIDCIYSAIYPKCITILSFITSLMCYVMTGSKSVCRIISSVTPSGCYNTLLNWLKEQSSSYIPPPSDIDIISFFDNNQILSRNWNVRYNCKALVSVITTNIHLLPPLPTYLQSDPSLSPSSWLYCDMDTVEMTRKIREFISDYDTVFNQYRHSYLKFLLNSVRQEHITGTIVSKNISVAEACNVQSRHTGTTNVVTGLPIFLNPCSYRAVQDVLLRLKDGNCHNLSQRVWSMIGCDGLPYVLGSRLIEQDAALQDIYLIPGLGHFEINMAKSCFKLLWDVILSDIANVMGYKSTKALTACKKCTDHHKAWQLLSITMTAVSKELMMVFIRYCEERRIDPDIDNFYRYMRLVENPNVAFLHHAMFTYVFALFLFRAGERMNDSDVIMAARMKFSPLFFGLNQTFYQEIDIRDVKARVCSPPQVSSFLKNHETFTVSGSTSKGEGGDFVLESKNRKIKRMMPPGHPDRQTWERVVKTADKTDQVYFYIYDNLNSLLFHVHVTIIIKHSESFLINNVNVQAPYMDPHIASIARAT